MRRLKLLSLSLATLAVASCSSRAPVANDTPTTPDSVKSPPPAADPPGDPRERILSKRVLKLIEGEHLLGKPIDDALSRTAFATYLDRLDGGKMFLLRADRDALAPFADKIDDELRAGALDLAHEGERLFAARVKVVSKDVAELLAAPFDFTKDELVELDPKKLELAATEEELRDRWRQHLELEVLEKVSQMETALAPPKPDKDKNDKDKDDADANLDERAAMPIAEIPTTPEGREAKARVDLAKTYAARFARLVTPGPLDAAAVVINAVTSSLDPHSDYLPPAEKANFDIQMSGSLEGIGAILRERDHYIEIRELVPGGPSWRQGELAPGDLILSVQAEGQDPVDVGDMRIDQVVKMIRGPKGTVVRLHVQKPAGTQKTVAITREVVVIEETYARGAVLTRKGERYGYIQLSGFYGSSPGGRTAAGDVQKLLRELKAHKVAGIVLDLRENGGGLLGTAIELTGELIDQGPVVQVQDGRGRHEVLNDDTPGEDYDGPVVVLVDRFSASASEIVAGALQDYHRAVIVGAGASTHGKGTVQTLAQLDPEVDLGVLKLTIQQFFRPSGSSTQLEGVIPDIVLPDPEGYVEAGERKLEHAIPWSRISAAAFAPWPAKWKVEVLAQKSAARVAKQPIFANVVSSVDLLRERMKDTKIPLMRSAWEARRTSQKAALEAATPNLKKIAAAFAVEAIDAPPPVAPQTPGGKVDDRNAKWSDRLSRDPWVDETLSILGDMR